MAASVEYVASILSIVHGYEIGDWLSFPMCHPSDNARGHVTGIGVATSVEHVASILSIVHGYDITCLPFTDGLLVG